MAEETKGLRQEDDSLWWGWSSKDGWVVLDREDVTNRPPSRERRLIRCTDWSEFVLPLDLWEAPIYRYYRVYLASLGDEASRKEAQSALADVQQQYHTRRDHFRGVREERQLRQQELERQRKQHCRERYSRCRLEAGRLGEVFGFR